MAQGVLPFKYEAEKISTGMTGLAGLPVYLDLAQVIGLDKSIQKHLKIREGAQGWTDSQMVISLILLNLAGGDCVEDIKKVEADTTSWVISFCLNIKDKIEIMENKKRRNIFSKF